MKYNSKAVRLSDVIVRDIWEGRFDGAKYLPGEDVLAREYEVSRTTIRRVLDILNREGVLIKEPNRGSLINPDLKSRLSVEDLSAGTLPPEKITLGAVWAGFPDAMTIGISDGIKAYAAEAGIGFHLFQNVEGHAKVLEELAHVNELAVSGIVVLPYNFDGYAEALRKLAARDFPLVCVDRPVKGLELSCIEVDNAGGVYRAVVKMLVEFRRPVYYLGAEPENDTQRLRYEGYCRAMNDGGFDREVEKCTCFYPSTDNRPEFWPVEKKQEPPYRAALEFLRRVERPVSIMAMNDYVARGIYRAAEELKLKIGRDVMVFGFDDLPLASCLECPLSSVRQPRREIGYEAAKLLHERIMGRVNRPVTKCLPVELIERESSRLSDKM
ncbi:substrate-binding domain-containing protein [Victivallis vadensis]|jgi:transcriptional regulator, gntR family with lacI sensor|uniref:substrate-binding domain-containing protein n=1 Tax=Victivallis vadensis TaxID=172901 RepID=UPI003AF9ED99